MKLPSLLQSPLKVLLLCLSFAFLSLLLNGGWMRLYSLRRDRTELQGQIQRLQTQLASLDVQLKRAKDPTFIEHQAMDQLDMASDEDLVFIFSD